MWDLKRNKQKNSSHRNRTDWWLPEARGEAGPGGKWVKVVKR